MMVDIDKVRLLAWLDRCNGVALGYQDEASGKRERIAENYWAGYRDALLLIQWTVKAGHLNTPRRNPDTGAPTGEQGEHQVHECACGKSRHPTMAG